MARQRKRPTTLELSDRDYARLRRRLEDLADADTRRERRAAEDALEQLAEQLELDDDVVDALVDGNVRLEAADDDDRGSSSSRRRADDDDDRGSSRRRSDDDDRGGSRSRSSSSGRRSVRLVDADDDADDDDDGDDRGSRSEARSLRELGREPGARVKKTKKDDEPTKTPDVTHWFHRRLGGASAGGAS